MSWFDFDVDPTPPAIPAPEDYTDEDDDY